MTYAALRSYFENLCTTYGLASLSFLTGDANVIINRQPRQQYPLLFLEIPDWDWRDFGSPVRHCAIAIVKQADQQNITQMLAALDDTETILQQFLWEMHNSTTVQFDRSSFVAEPITGLNLNTEVGWRLTFNILSIQCQPESAWAPPS